MPYRFDTAEQAEAAFYAALEMGDLDAMAAIWEQSSEVACVHPGGSQLLGYEQVLESWREILGNSGGFRIAAELLHHHTDDCVSVRFLNETLFTGEQGVESFTVLATNAYRKTEAGWRLVLHHASPTPHSAGSDATDEVIAEEDEGTITLH